jgi:hypothetical protein
METNKDKMYSLVMNGCTMHRALPYVYSIDNIYTMLLSLADKCRTIENPDIISVLENEYQSLKSRNVL